MLGCTASMPEARKEGGMPVSRSSSFAVGSAKEGVFLEQPGTIPDDSMTGTEIGPMVGRRDLETMLCNVKAQTLGKLPACTRPVCTPPAPATIYEAQGRG